MELRLERKRFKGQCLRLDETDLEVIHGELI